MKKLIILLTIPALLLIACNSTEDICSNILLVDSDISNIEQYLIIEAIINDNFNNSNLTHISQETHFMADSMRFSRYFDNDNIEIESGVIEDYIKINSVPFNWANSFDTKQNLISEEELVCLFENNGWTGFYSKYPDSDGYLKFGKPLQNDNKALVTFVLHCYWECSSGHTATLIKEDGKWKVINVITAWIS